MKKKKNKWYVCIYLYIRIEVSMQINFAEIRKGALGILGVCSVISLYL